MRYTALILFLFTFQANHGQQPLENLTLYSTKEGLTNNFIYSIEQDSRKFLWIGTKEGLNRFDGDVVKQFFAGKNSDSSLPNNNIFSIIEYKYGQLLIATGSGLAVYNTLTGQFENDKIKPPPLKAGSRITINSLYKDPSGKIWVNHSGAIDMLDSNLSYKGRLSDEPWAKNIKGILARFGKWHMDNENRLWIASDTSGINIIDFKLKQVWNSKNNPKHLSYLKTEYIRSFLLDEKDHTLWYAPWGLGLISYNLNTGEEHQLRFGYTSPSEEGCINSIIKNREGNFFCAGGADLYEVSAVDLSYKSIEHSYGHLLYMTSDSTYWEASNKGLFKLPDETYAQKSLLENSNISFKQLAGILPTDSGRIYAIDRMGILASVETINKRISFFPFPLEKTNRRYFTCVNSDPSGNIWVGTDRGILIFNPSTNKYVNASFSQPSISSATINAIHKDHKGNMWLATVSPFCIYKYFTKEKRTEKIDNAVLNKFAALYTNSRISKIAEDKDDNLWMISTLGGGIIFYSKKTDEWKLYPGGHSNNLLLTERGLTSINIDSKGRLWLTDYYGNGLMQYDFGKDNLTQFTRNDGLLSDYIQSVQKGPSDDLIISTEKGITLFNTLTFKVKNIGLPENFQSFPDEPLQTVYDDRSGSFVGLSGNRLFFVPLKIKSTDKNEFISPVIDRISINNIPYNINAADTTLLLSHEKNTISIDFTGANFKHQKEDTFFYRMIGTDRQWTSAGKNRVAHYANLPAGSYEFQLRSGNNVSPTSFRFRIIPPWWQTTVFKILAVLIIISIIYIIMKIWIRQIKKEANLKHKIAETEMMALRAQMNPHFVFNCLSAIDNMIQTNQKDKATTYLSRFGKLIRLILESSKHNLVPFHKDLESLNLFLELEQFRSNNKFEYELKVGPEVINSDYKVPPLIIQPFVENAIHHGLMNKTEKDKKLSIQIGLDNENIKYTIEDNGVGRQKAEELRKLNRPEHVSYGIEIARKRLSLQNKNEEEQNVIITDLKKADEYPGTKVELWLSVK